MLLAIDAGNTNIVFAVYDGERQVASWRCSTDAGRTSDEYAAFLHQLFTLSGLSFKQITDTIISSVVPDANFHLRSLSARNFGCKAQMVGDPDLDLGLAIKTNKPEEVGADRLVNAVAAIHFYQKPAIVVDFGTATTFDVVGEDGAYWGGVIAPGVNLSMESLHRAAAKLPRVSIGRPDTVIGRDTVSAMRAGIYWGYIGMIEGTIRRISDEMRARPFVIGTGGLAGLFAGDTQAIHKIDEDLTLRGLVQIHQNNRKAKAA